ncbi:MNIO family bufferin maturase [Parasphingorhabdus sp.]|uniref:MNIO family bufferin maturase n=1 Tax=Parasphingorhabdus sp. TaxID=2709688 RepID=UPI0030013546
MPRSLPRSGGIGLKSVHYQDVLDDAAKPGRPSWVEVHPQNYFGDGGPAHRWLTAIAGVYPLSFHSVGLSLGSADGLRTADLDQLATLCDRYQPAMVSDHLSWSGNAHDRYPDLLPIPYTGEALDHLVREIGKVQDRLRRSILIENPSRYLGFRDDEMTEPEFIHALCRKAGCGLLFDINNVEVTATNVGLDMDAYVDAIDPAIVGEIHLAGHAREDHPSGPLLIDDHGSAVSAASWDLYRRFVNRAGARPTLIEWDSNIPDYAVLMAELAKVETILGDGQASERRHALAR